MEKFENVDVIAALDAILHQNTGYYQEQFKQVEQTITAENPKRGKKDYGKWLGDKKPLSAQEKVRAAIDAALAEKPADFAAFLRLFEASGLKLQRRGKTLSFISP